MFGEAHDKQSSPKLNNAADPWDKKYLCYYVLPFN